jgi:hypothetical protein
MNAAKTPKAKTPIMTSEEERFMAFEGLVQWTQAVVAQSSRVSAARDHQLSNDVMRDPTKRGDTCFSLRVPFLCHCRAQVARISRLGFDFWALRFRGFQRNSSVF